MPVQKLEGYCGSIQSVVFSPDGKRLVCGSANGTILVFEENDAGTFKQAYGLEGHDLLVSSVVFSTTGRHLASGSYDGTVRIWEGNGLGGLRRVDTFKPNDSDPGRIYSIDFSPDGRQIAAGCGDGYVYVFDVARTPQ